jgi:HK97 family phage prohead protease
MKNTKNDFKSNQEQRICDMPVELRSTQNNIKSRAIFGYAFKWNVLSNRMGWFREKIERGALEGVDINEMDIVALFNHNNNLIHARNIAKTLTLGVDDIGLHYEFEAPNTSAGNDLLENIKLGNVRHSSFSFTVAPGGD